jgi:hypothetical protein
MSEHTIFVFSWLAQKDICDRDLIVKAEAFDGQFLELSVEDED